MRKPLSFSSLFLDTAVQLLGKSSDADAAETLLTGT